MGSSMDSQRWLAYAEEDFAYGKLGLTMFPRASAWSFQQAAEKALKACLLHRGEVPPRTHDLLLLLNLVTVIDHPELKSAVLLLAEITAASRYPDDIEEVTVGLAGEYELAVRQVIDFAHGVSSRA